MRFCANCGAAIASTVPPPWRLSPAPIAEGGERRFLVLLFCDLVGSTEMSARLDPEEVRDVMRAYQAAISTAIRGFGGHVAREIGDGALIYFGWPQAHENDAERSVLAGLAIVEEVERVDRELEADIHLEVRVGIHAGFLVVERSGEIFGDTPNIAARVQSAAQPGTVFISEAMLQLLAGRCRTENAGRFELKGIGEPLTLHRVLGVSMREQSLAQAPARMVGRTREIAQLDACWKITCRGVGQVVAIVGEAGIGKSCLVRSLRERIAPPPGGWLELAGSELHQQTPFFPIVQPLERHLGLHASLSAAERMMRLHDTIAQAHGSRDDMLAPLADLLGLTVVASYAVAHATPERRRDAILNALVAWILGQARQQPILFVVEDRHWLDPSTSELIERLEERLDEAALLLVVTERPAERAGATASTTLALGPMATADIRTVVADIAAQADVADPVIDRIVARAGGNPLFAVELARLVAGRSGQANEHEIPTTLAGSLTARLDALGFDKEIVQMGAVLGDGFSRAIALELSQIGTERLDRSLDRLIRTGILRPADNRESFSFSHALVRDTAYETVLRSRRRELHRRAARILARPGAEGHAARPEVAAHHWYCGEEFARAAQAWHDAGLAASGRGAFREAESSWRRSLESLERLPASTQRDIQELTTRNLLVSALQITHGYSSPEVSAVHERVLALSEKTGDASQLFEKTATEWVMLSTQGRFVEGNRLADEIYQLAGRLGRRAPLAHAHMMQLTARYRVGDLQGAEQAFLRGLAFYDDTEFHNRPGTLVQAFGTAARNAWLLGMADTAQERSDYALLAVADRPFDLAFAQYMAAILAMLMDEPKTALALGTQSIETSDASKFPVYSAISRVVVGRAVAALGDAADGAALIDDGIARMERTGSRNGITLYLAWAAEAQGLGKRWDLAAETINKALSINPEERFFEAECLRIRGETAAARGRIDDAIDDFVASHRAARQMGARISEMRTWLASRRLGLGDRRLPTVREMAQLYAQMSQGRSTPDMKKAEAWISQATVGA